MGIRKRVKGLVKRAVARESSPSGPVAKQAVAPSPSAESKPLVEGGGNLRDGEEVPWYLKYDDSDGWESANAEEGVDED